MSAELLRDAAATTRTLATAADSREEWYGVETLTALGLPPEDAALIARMTPAVAIYLAAWLDCEASGPRHACPNPHALDLARHTTDPDR